ncbi:MAG TPA: hypothetical protein VFE46_10775 [Pirellulales bacterium]|nr:hypothetical protein [Pirellulales bacterium]
MDDLFESQITPLEQASFGATFTYTMIGGETRSGTVVEEERGAYRDADDRLVNAEQLTLTVQRRVSNSCPGALVIDNPQLTETVNKDSTNFYTFTGEINRVTDDSWSLVFVRQLSLLTGQFARR